MRVGGAVVALGNVRRHRRGRRVLVEVSGGGRLVVLLVRGGVLLVRRLARRIGGRVVLLGGRLGVVRLGRRGRGVDRLQLLARIGDQLVPASRAASSSGLVVGL